MIGSPEYFGQKLGGTYVGCFEDKDGKDRDVLKEIANGADMTPENCFNEARK